MSNWKQQIDLEIGTNPRFTEKLQNEILQKSTKQKKFNVAYPLTIIGACLVALFLFVTWPENQEPQVASSSPMTLSKFAEESSVKNVYVSFINFSDAHFYARPSIFALGVSKVNVDDTLDVTKMLQTAKLEDGGMLGSLGYHVLIETDNGEQKKLIVSRYLEGTHIFDVETKLSYKTNEDFNWIFEKNVNAFNSLGFIFMILLMISFKLICVDVKNRAPQSLKIYLQFLALVLLVIGLLSVSTVLSIWLPVAFLLMQAIMRYMKLKKEGYDELELKKIERYTIILYGMWGTVLGWQLVGGIL